MARKELSVESRAVLGKKVAVLRRAGILPANVYGHGVASVSVQVSAADLRQTMREAAANEVIDLRVGGEAEVRPVVIHHIQRQPLTGGILHADFYQVSLSEKVRADIPLVLVGQSEAVTTYSGVLLTGIEAVHIEGLPLDIPGHIEVDISSLAELDSALHVRDLNVPATLTVLTDPDVVVARVASPRVADEEVVAPTEAVAAVAPGGAPATAESGEAEPAAAAD